MKSKTRERESFAQSPTLRPFPKMVVIKSKSFVEDGTVSKYNPKDLRSLTISVSSLATLCLSLFSHSHSHSNTH